MFPTHLFLSHTDTYLPPLSNKYSQYTIKQMEKQKILIIQNGNLNPCIQNYLNPDDDSEIVKSFETDFALIENLESYVNSYDLIIILGGYQSVLNINILPHLQSVVTLIHTAIQLQKPIIGICLGCQLIAYALGCTIKSSHRLNIGYDVSIMGQTNIFRSHIDYIVPTDAIQVLETVDRMPYLFKASDSDLRVYGIQCHPDMSPFCVKRAVDERYEHLRKFANDNYDAISNGNRAIIQQILTWIREKN